MVCHIFGAGDFYGLKRRIGRKDIVIAADGGYRHCQAAGIEPHLLLGDFDSLAEVPNLPHIRRVPVEKDDTDMMLAVKEGLARGFKDFCLYGGMGGQRTDHTIANLQTLVYLAHRGARGFLYGNGEIYTVIRNEELKLPARKEGTLSIFCMGPDAAGVTIRGAQYPLEKAVLTADFPLGVSNHFVGNEITVSVEQGCLLIGLRDE